MYARQALVVDVGLVPSKAMLRVWDAGWYLHPASVNALDSPEPGLDERLAETA